MYLFVCGRLGRVHCLFHSHFAYPEVICERTAAESDWRKPVAPRQGAAIRHYQF